MLDTVGELALQIAGRVGIPLETATRLAERAWDAIQASSRPGYRFVPLPDGEPEITEESARAACDSFLASMPRFSANQFRGRGIVICGGTARLFTCAWVCINMLRRSGCNLPIELWYLGPSELDRHMATLVSPLGVACVDALTVRQRHPVRTLRGWELKPFAILYSSFEDVLLLDADNVPIVNPDFLFDSPAYRTTGAVFWPNLEQVSREHRMWQVFAVRYRDEPEFETGQVLVSKRRCWRALQMTMHLNEHSDFYYRYFHGDAETFHLAWRYLGEDFALPDRPPERLSGTLCQHDFGGRRILQHRNGWKWDDPDVHVEGFAEEDACRALCRLLAEQWPIPSSD
ncbi:MAG: hypothetical protein GEU82_15080 [Luteitalea sp.]|nr:hypothetical protein [Luteitalea sp.]